MGDEQGAIPMSWMQSFQCGQCEAECFESMKACYICDKKLCFKDAIYKKNGVYCPTCIEDKTSFEQEFGNTYEW